MRTNSILPDLDRVKELLAVTGTTIRPGGLALTERAVEVCRLGPGSRIADIGCGVGGSLEYLHRAYNINGFGIDPSAILLDAGRRRFAVTNLIQGIAEELPFRDGCLDGILCECVLTLIVDIDSALSEFWRVLKPGGYLLLNDIYVRFFSPEHSVTQTSGSLGTRTKEEITGLLMRHQFSLLSWEDHTEELKELAVQLILTHGSVNGFRKALCKDERRRNDRLLHLPSHPGYFLLIAQKSAGR